MTRRVPSVTAAAVAVLALVASTPATADEPATTTATATGYASPNGAVSGGGEITRPNPTAPTTRTPRVLVFGDSISATARYSLSGGRLPQAWWSHLAASVGVPAHQIMVSAEGGSGLLARGSGVNRRKCTGSTFGDRLGDIATSEPDVVIVEVGRNDVSICIAGTRVPATPNERRAAATSYFGELARIIDRQGIRRSNVYVLSPWGSSVTSGSVATTTLYEALSTSRGFSWVPTPALVRQQTLDSIHPNALGTRDIARAVLRSSDIATAIRTRGTRHATVPSGVRVECPTLARCRARGIKTNQYSRARRALWGAAVGTDRHYVAHRLTQGGRRIAPILTARPARQWRLAAVAESAARPVAHAKVGDIAWWSTAPAGSAAASQGHVAVVERVAKNNSWVDVSEVTSRGAYRAVRYSGASLPRAYLRFKRTSGGPRGNVGIVSAKRGTLTVRGAALDTDRPHQGVRLRVKVTQNGRTWTRTTTRPGPIRFTHRFAVPGLSVGKTTVRITALDTPGSRGKNRTLGVHRVTVR